MYPWNVGKNAIKDWEYKLVKLRGCFREERFFIRRERDGKDGYLVFAPFTTAKLFGHPDGSDESAKRVEFSLFVNLGWVPKENLKDIERTTEAVPILDPPTEPELMV